MSSFCEIKPFGAGIMPQTGDITELHERLQPTSPAAGLGPTFMKYFYYRSLPREDLLFGGVAYVDGRPAGFVSASADPTGFLRTALHRHWLRLFCVVVVSILGRPSRIHQILIALQRKRSREAARSRAAKSPSAGAALSMAELISGGVLPEYQKPSFVRKTGFNAWHELIENTLAQCRKRGCSSVRARVSIYNPGAHLYYLRTGWTQESEHELGQYGEIVEYSKSL